jgi:hypothetical protein
MDGEGRFHAKTPGCMAERSGMAGKTHPRYTNVAGEGRVTGKGRLAVQVALREGVAAPLLGGVRGWVYLYETSYLRFTATP